MEKFIVGDQGFLGELKELPNPKGLIFRSNADLFETAVEAVTVMKADVASKEDFEKAMQDLPVTAFRSNSFAVDFPVLVEQKSYEEYLHRICEAE